MCTYVSSTVLEAGKASGMSLSKTSLKSCRCEPSQMTDSDSIWMADLLQDHQTAILLKTCFIIWRFVILTSARRVCVALFLSGIDVESQMIHSWHIASGLLIPLQCSSLIASAVFKLAK